MRLPRKLKKRIIKAFGIGTYRGIMKGFLTTTKYHKNQGVEIVYTDKVMGCKVGDIWFYAHQYNPYLKFPNLKFEHPVIKQCF